MISTCSFFVYPVSIAMGNTPVTSGPDEVTETAVQTQQGRLYRHCWWPHPEKTPKALLFISHGAGEHVRRYDSFALKLAEELNILVFAHDHLGHGKSEGERMQVETFDHYAEHVILDIRESKKRYNAQYGQDLPCFLFAHSMGGLIGLMAVIKEPSLVKAVITSGALVFPDPNAATPLKIMLANWTAYLLPSLPVASIDPTTISRNPEEVQKYTTDPLVYHGGLKARWAVQSMVAMEWLQEQAKTIRLPIYILHGENDKLVQPESSTFLNQHVSSQDKTMKIYPSAFHEILNELPEVVAEVQNDIIKWLQDRL
eukprot:m.111089 g.111089  ORF g.111089 m.111089 type:complete len:313 (+) comp22755_c0_seq2:70-1008(+)